MGPGLGPATMSVAVVATAEYSQPTPPPTNVRGTKYPVRVRPHSDIQRFHTICPAISLRNSPFRARLSDFLVSRFSDCRLSFSVLFRALAHMRCLWGMASWTSAFEVFNPAYVDRSRWYPYRYGLFAFPVYYILFIRF